MTFLKKTIGWICVVMFLSIFCNFGFVQASDQPFMQSALDHLEKALGQKMGKGIQLNKAKADLESATADKGGHRVAAINKINLALDALKLNDFAGTDRFTMEAINQVKAGIGFADPNTPIATAPQPFMQAALKNLELALGSNMVTEKIAFLEKAKINLNSADTDKGGHRVAAIGKIDLAILKLNNGHPIEGNALIRQAIDQVKMGIDVGNLK